MRCFPGMVGRKNIYQSSFVGWCYIFIYSFEGSSVCLTSYIKSNGIIISEAQECIGRSGSE